MSFLSPWLALAVAAVVVPALLILYFLKLRRRQELVPSTFLWRRAVQDLQVNAPFQRLRKNLLLLLQLLVIGAAVTALARPVVKSSLTSESSIVLLIDRSGSMNADEGGKTRLELAKEQAKRIVKALNRTRSDWFSFAGVREPTRVMVIAFADRATIVSPFTTNTAELGALIDAIEPTDADSNIREALELAEAYMAITRGDLRPNVGEAASRLVILSDGGVADTRDLTPRAGAVELIRIGQASDNVGITAMRLQRNYERPEQLSVFVQVQNSGPAAVSTDVSLLFGPAPDRMSLGRVQSVQLGAAAPLAGQPVAAAAEREAAGPPAGANTALTFELTLPQGALLEARLARPDALMADNRAYAVAPPPRRLSVLLVTSRNFFLSAALAGLPLQKTPPDTMTPDEYESTPSNRLETNGQSLYDVVIFDKHDTARLPAGNFLFIRSLPKLEGISKLEEIGSHAVMWWDDAHPILRHVAMEYVVAGSGLGVALPREAEVLAEGPRGPVLARYSRDGRQFVLLTFAVEDSIWWQQPSFPIFVYNALRYLGAGGAVGEDVAVRPGSALRVPLPAGERETVVMRPAGQRRSVRADSGGVAQFADTLQAGVYSASPAAPGYELHAINMASGLESDIRTRGLTIGTQAVAEGQTIDTATPEIWRWFAGAALVILLVEWIVYNRRVMI